MDNYTMGGGKSKRLPQYNPIVGCFSSVIFPHLETFKHNNARMA